MIWVKGVGPESRQNFVLHVYFAMVCMYVMTVLCSIFLEPMDNTMHMDRVSHKRVAVEGKTSCSVLHAIACCTICVCV